MATMSLANRLPHTKKLSKLQSDLTSRAFITGSPIAKHGPRKRYLVRFVSMMFAAASCFSAAGPVAAAEPLAVEFAPVTPSDRGLTVRLTGTLAATETVDLGFRQGGRIREIAVAEGDDFQSGDVLGRIEPLQQKQSLNAAEAALAAAEATRALSAQSAQRAEALLARGVGTRADRDQADQALSAANAQTALARTALDQAQRAVDDTELIAPFDGVVTDRAAEVGQVVGPATTVLSLAANGGIEAVFLTPDLSKLADAIGTEVTFTTIEFDAPEMHGAVTEIAPLIDPATGSVRVRARVADAPADRNLLGAAVRGSISLPDDGGVFVPWTALTSVGGKPAVWIVQSDSTVELRPVDILRFDNDTVLLSAGVKAGEIAVGAGSQMLYPGRPVIDGNPE